MKIILLRDVPKVGKKFELKTVADGFARNNLIPRGFAMLATSESEARITLLKKQDEGRRAVNEELALKNLGALEGKRVLVSGKANDEGHLFAGIHAEEISKAIKEQLHLEIPESVLLITHPIKSTGDTTVDAAAAGKSIQFTLAVEASV